LCGQREHLCVTCDTFVNPAGTTPVRDQSYTPCHGDVFHIQRQCEGLANALARLAKGATARRQTL